MRREMEEKISELRELHESGSLSSDSYLDAVLELATERRPYPENEEGLWRPSERPWLRCGAFSEALGELSDGELRRAGGCERLRGIYISSDSDSGRSCALRNLADRCPEKFEDTFQNFVLPWEPRDYIILYAVERRRLMKQGYEGRFTTFRNWWDMSSADGRLGGRRYQKKFGDRFEGSRKKG
jgi:hypothetical protein